MCQYYRWTCSACRCTQDCLCRCPLAQHHGICARTTEPLALPYDTPSILCQQGGTTRSSCVPSSFAHGAAQPRTLSHRPSPNICGLPEPPIPPMDDIFWLKPIARLPDRTEILPGTTKREVPSSKQARLRRRACSMRKTCWKVSARVERECVKLLGTS